ncbi:MAG: hypothetical protein PVF51_10920 [Nitrospirota bacterium]|jgi:hypothetical protein
MISLGITFGDLDAADTRQWVDLLEGRFKLACKVIPGRSDGAVQVTGEAEAIEAAFSHLRGAGVAAEPLEL